jgi:hypothetical protein
MVTNNNNNNNKVVQVETDPTGVYKQEDSQDLPATVSFSPKTTSYHICIHNKKYYYY